MTWGFVVVIRISWSLLLLPTHCQTGDSSVEDRIDSLSAIMCQSNHAVWYKGYCVFCVGSFTDDGDDSPLSNLASADVVCPLDVFAYNARRGATYLDGRTLRAVTIVRPPFVESRDREYTGVIFEFLRAFGEKYNFSLETSLPYDGNWGARMKNGTWNGMIGMVVRNEADIGAAGFTITYERSQAVSFTIPFHQEPSAILIPPPTEGEKLTVLIRPLSKRVWASVLGTVFIVIPSMYVLHQGSKSIQGLPVTKGPLAVISEIVWFILASILQQSLRSPADKTTRFLTMIWWFVTLVIANAYLAFLVSFLSSPRLHDIVDSLEELAAMHKKLKWTFRSNTVHRDLFMSETSTGTYKLIGDRTHEDNLVSNDAEGVEHVLKLHQAFIKEKSYLDVALSNDFAQTQRCRMTTAKETFFTAGIALALHKESHFLVLLDYCISNSIATGIMSKWKQFHWPKYLWCEDAVGYITSTQPKVRKLNMPDLQGAYFLLGSGLTLAAVVFLANHVTETLASSWRFHIFRLKFYTAWRFIR